jgi:hypothetical protein
MAVEMTREEYAKKYGNSPQVLTPQGRQKAQTATQGSFISRAAEKITDFVGARGIAEQYGSSIARATVPEEQRDLVPNPSVKEVVGSALQTGANFIPGAGAGASLGIKAATGAATGLIAGTGARLQAGEDFAEAVTPGAEVVFGAALPVVGKLIGLAPKALEKANLRMTPTEQQKLAAKGKDVVSWMADRKIVGTPEQRLQRLKVLSNEMEDAVTSLLANDGSALTKEQIITSARSVLADYADDPLALPEVERAVNDFQTFILRKNTHAIPVSTINTYKRSFWERGFAKNKADVVNEAKYAIGSSLKRLLDAEVPGLQAINKEYGPIIEARRVLTRAATRNQLSVLSRAVATGVGAAAGGSVASYLGAAVGGVAAERLASVLATPIRSGTGATITTLRQVLEKLPVDEKGNIPVKLLIQAIAGEEQDDAE